MSKRDIRFDSLEEAEEALKESQENVVKARNSGREVNKDPGIKQYPDDEEGKKRFVTIGLIVIAVLVVIAVVLTVNKKRAAAEAQAQLEASIAASEAEAQSLAEEARLAEEEDDSFTECAVPEINELAANYFDARLKSDSSRLYTLFGRNDTAANDAFEKKLRAQASWIQGFNDIKVYTAPGMEANETFCLVTYIIDFRRTDTMAPGIMYFFARANADGTYSFEENLVKDKLDYAEKLMDKPFAAGLISDTDAKLKEALDSNSTIALIYTSFLNGEIYKESNLEVNADQQVDVFLNPEDSVLVDDDTLKTIESEAAQAASIEASEGAEDVYETAADEGSDTADTENTDAAETAAQ